MIEHAHTRTTDLLSVGHMLSALVGPHPSPCRGLWVPRARGRGVPPVQPNTQNLR
jgi:hypothetical protein